jgi:hypothetical protein
MLDKPHSGVQYFTDDDDITNNVDISKQGASNYGDSEAGLKTDNANQDSNIPTPIPVGTEINMADTIDESYAMMNLVSKYGNTKHLGYEMMTEMEKMEKVIDEKTARIYVKKIEFNQVMEDSKPNTQYNIMSVFQMKQLEEWTRLKCRDILFDSNVDNCLRLIASKHGEAVKWKTGKPLEAYSPARLVGKVLVVNKNTVQICSPEFVSVQKVATETIKG